MAGEIVEGAAVARRWTWVSELSETATSGQPAVMSSSFDTSAAGLRTRHARTSRCRGEMPRLTSSRVSRHAAWSNTNGPNFTTEDTESSPRRTRIDEGGIHGRTWPQNTQMSQTRRRLTPAGQRSARGADEMRGFVGRGGKRGEMAHLPPGAGGLAVEMELHVGEAAARPPSRGSPSAQRSPRRLAIAAGASAVTQRQAADGAELLLELAGRRGVERQVAGVVRPRGELVDQQLPVARQEHLDAQHADARRARRAWRGNRQGFAARRAAGTSAGAIERSRM